MTQNKRAAQAVHSTELCYTYTVAIVDHGLLEFITDVKTIKLSQLYSLTGVLKQIFKNKFTISCSEQIPMRLFRTEIKETNSACKLQT